MQVCPVFLNLLDSAARTAALMSAELNTMNGAFPPSSMETRLTVSAHWDMRTWRPGGVGDRGRWQADGKEERERGFKTRGGVIRLLTDLHDQQLWIQ